MLLAQLCDVGGLVFGRARKARAIKAHDGIGWQLLDVDGHAHIDHAR